MTDDAPELTAAHLRQLLDSPNEDPVIYLKATGNGSELGVGQELDVWAAALVPCTSIVVRRNELLDMLTGVGPDAITTDDLTWAAGALQDNVEQAEPMPDDD